MNVYMNRALPINAKQPAVMDEDVLETLYRQYSKNIYNYIYFRLRNHFDAEELTNVVFEKAIRSFHTFNPDCSPAEAWLIGIAKNAVTDFLRKRKYKVFVPFDNLFHLSSTHPQPEEVALQNEENKQLLKAMSKLKEKEQQILSMKFATDLKNSEIASILNMTESNVGVTIHRCLKKLMKWLGKECDAQ